MGYTTDFCGEFKLNKKLSPKRHDYLNRFNETRRMARKLPTKYGVEGEFYAPKDSAQFGQEQTPDIISYNCPPKTQPGLWCGWRPTQEGMGIEWDGGEKFYNYIEWLQYIVTNFLAPKGYILNGEVTYQGEDSADFGKIVVKDNEIKVLRGIRLYGDEEQSEA